MEMWDKTIVTNGVACTATSRTLVEKHKIQIYTVCLYYKSRSAKLHNWGTKFLHQKSLSFCYLLLATPYSGKHIVSWTRILIFNNSCHILYISKLLLTVHIVSVSSGQMKQKLGQKTVDHSTQKVRTLPQWQKSIFIY